MLNKSLLDIRYSKIIRLLSNEFLKIDRDTSRFHSALVENSPVLTIYMSILHKPKPFGNLSTVCVTVESSRCATGSYHMICSSSQ